MPGGNASGTQLPLYTPSVHAPQLTNSPNQHQDGLDGLGVSLVSQCLSVHPGPGGLTESLSTAPRVHREWVGLLVPMYFSATLQPLTAGYQPVCTILLKYWPTVVDLRF